tara:strand:+ start:47038 stop:48291 length:1254 start_codon:yes stop_codon:yes gene_type:complete
VKKSNLFTKIKFVVLGLFLFFLFHFESLSIGSVKISHLWKGILLLFLIFKILSKKRKQLFVYKPLILLAVLQLVNVELFINPFNAVFLFLTTLLLPLLGIYVLQFSSLQLQKVLLFFSSFFILSFIPYELGIIESYGKLYNLASYGDAKQSGIIGPFQSPHAASTALAGSFLVILYFWFTKYVNRIYLSILLILSFYLLIFTYVRTGMLMVTLGIIPMLLYFVKKGVSTRIRLIFIGGIFSVLISGWILSNEVLIDRITGNRINKVETDSFEELGSGRGQIYSYAVDIFLEANIFEKVIGVGQTEQVKRMDKKLGSGLIPHNGFLLILLNTGAIGLFVFLVFIRKVINSCGTLAPSDKILTQGLLFAYVIMTFFQNYDLIYAYLLLVLSVAHSNKLTNQKKLNQIYFSKYYHLSDDE